jgi:hypothetical protein
VTRWLITIVIFLLAGAAANVSVAAACWLSGPRWTLPQQTSSHAAAMGLWNRYATMRPWHLSGDLHRSVTVTDIELRDLDYTVEPNWRRVLKIRQVGWPVRCFARVSLRRTPYSIREAFEPLWRGIAANTLFYAAILWLLYAGLFVLRRGVRSRRGLCPKCAYPMGEADTCTECGKPLPHRAVA